MTSEPPFRYVDLFAGIGGFAAALRSFGGAGVYSVEKDPAAARVYELNWGRDPLGDLTEDANDNVMRVPEHDVLAAGFPCQPFSKSGAQRGMDETRGTLFWNILKVIEVRRPAIILLENVRNLAGPRHLHEWQVIIENLTALGYRVADQPAVFSPHLLPLEMGGRPHVRERVFITATYDPSGLMDGVEPVPVVENRSLRGPEEWDLASDLPLEPVGCVDERPLTRTERLWIDAWDEWVRIMWALHRDEARRSGTRVSPLPGFPLWVDAWVRTDALCIPEETPAWKRTFLRKNSELYTKHQEAFDDWIERHDVRAFPPSRRKFEWQAQGTSALWECVMQMRPSGIRAKRATHLPALVAIAQTSIVGGERKRRLSWREAARMQGLPDNFTFGDQSPAATYRQLGNGVNVGAVWHVLREHVRRDEAILKTTEVGRRIVQSVLIDAPKSPDDVLASVVAKAQTSGRD
ncbi:DNA (cytosine-5-)-methyltransferase [Actinotalea sp. C106]|uniref:DNA (cytosine-5-)-methyltransferase n=1 Tax=Actinotalea sp. C106 TaxID=2908644 RepID=UPI00202846B3|nr:DNA (cytosine-5-)-methyltransferase [Actinotalea sp. C106]